MDKPVKKIRKSHLGPPDKADKFNQKQLDQIKAMAGHGVKFDDIASIIGVNRDTLRKYAGEYLTLGKALAKANVSRAAYRMATSEKSSDMTKFWLTTQAGWSANNPATDVDAEEQEKLTSLLDATAQDDWG